MAQSKELLGFLDFFKNVPDHRNGNHKLHPVEEILLVAFCGVIAGCDGWEDVELFAENRSSFLKRYLPFEHGTPSDDTLRRFFRALDPKISEAGLVLGQEKVAEKSNEITAIPKLLELLDLTNAIVTIDAMGCQYEIADKIKAKKADYVLALKGSQGELHEDVKLAFAEKIKTSNYFVFENIDSGHGRIETRRCTVTEDIDRLKERYPKWKTLVSIVEIASERKFNNKIESEKRYYLSSLPADAEKILAAARLHWGIENRLHWVLDVSFGEDQSRIRKGNAPRNVGVIRKSVLNILQKAKVKRPRQSIKRMRKLAGWDESFLHSALTGKF